MENPNRVQALKAERDRYISLAFCWADLLFELDRDLTISFAAGATAVFTGRQPDELIGTSFRDVVAPADMPLVGQILKNVVQDGRANDEMLRLVGIDGKLLWVSMAAYCLDPESGRIFVGLKKSKSAAKADALAVPRDSSGLFDSGSFSELAASRLKKIQAAGENAAVTLVSIPQMTELRQRLDASAKTALEQSMSELLRANSIGGDSAGKLADDRFSLVHAEGANVQDLMDSVATLTRKIDPTGKGTEVHSSTVSMDEFCEVSEEDLAKGLLYTLNKFRDSDGGEVSLTNITSHMSDLVGEAAAEINSFKKIVAKSEFFVALQPIIHIGTGDIHHYEALCRFERNAGESPFRLITFAEETGLIHEFDLAMARKVVDWLAKFPRNSDRYRVAVNVSGFSIGVPAYVDALFQLLKDNEWTQGKLLFEITESSRMSDLETANRFIQNLRARHHHVCLDDFGAGAASFQYLSVLEVDVVKLDGSAVKNAQKAAKGRAFLSALTELCRRMKVETIAEMVDTPETLEFCRDCGCNYVQGFLFGRPSRDVKAFTPLPQGGLFKQLTNLKY